jgi:cell division protein FtsW (lipid II flippase)
MPSQIVTLMKPNIAWYVVVTALALSFMGVMVIGTVSPTLASDQSRWVVIALVGMVMCVLPHPKQLSVIAMPAMVITLALLVLLLLPGIPTWLVRPRNGARSWINLIFMDFQPAEMAKIVFVMALARYLRRRDSYRTLIGLLIPFLIMFIPVGLILKQPDLGSALLFPPALFAMLLAAGAKLRHLTALLSIGILAIVVNVAIIALDPPVISPNGRILPHPPATRWMHVLKPHQEARIAASISQFKGEKTYSRTTGYQQETAMMLSGAGGVLGMGDRSEVILRYNWLPERHNDMIFSIIVNRWGLVGGLVTMFLYLLLFYAFIVVAARSKDPFARLTTVGFAALLFTQATINVAVNIGLMPITGITLPFISYGGSSLLATFMMVGIVINFASRPPEMLARPSFEFDNREAIFQ